MFTNPKAPLPMGPRDSGSTPGVRNAGWVRVNALMVGRYIGDHAMEPRGKQTRIQGPDGTG